MPSEKDQLGSNDGFGGNCQTKNISKNTKTRSVEALKKELQ